MKASPKSAGARSAGPASTSAGARSADAASAGTTSADPTSSGGKSARAKSAAAPRAAGDARAFALALAAALCCVAALLGFGAALEGYSHWQHPPGLLGARGIPRALAFNLLGYVGPGLVLAWVAWRLAEAARGQRALARIGAWLWLWSALAWAAQGIVVLDPRDLDAQASRLHALAWLLWWLAFAPGAALLAWSALAAPAWRRFGAIALAAAAVVGLAVIAADARLVPAAPAQRVALLAWLAAYLAAARAPR
ncbi:DUF998 domain-containing protein [Lysobacter enzymogenes]|uniref:DUF998 domain-containing protein n=1 Tax=Lysobacter enzymogenes TaxID=69 RepID=UPI001AF82FE2|nr:DUF998 domain-containing protein [Lysobacter enzymogenes]QQQ02991.1 DUF998 domain-containing protein [Lysobacter enzymogenes]